MAIILISSLFKVGSILVISSVSPLFEITSTTSPFVTIPISPWLPSAGLRKKAGVPVEARVAAIFLPIRPDLPMPVTTTLPAHEYMTSRALTKFSLTWSIRSFTAFASILNISFA